LKLTFSLDFYLSHGDGRISGVCVVVVKSVSRDVVTSLAAISDDVIDGGTAATQNCARLCELCVTMLQKIAILFNNNPDDFFVPLGFFFSNKKRLF